MIKKAVIVGGGVGGLTAAIALRQRGIEATVYERAPAIGQVGAGLHLWTNALHVFQQLGIGDRAAAIGTPVERSEYVTSRGKMLAVWPVGEWARRYGAPTVGVTRPRLHDVLTEALDDEALVLASEATAFEQDGDGVTLKFADGREERGDILVGADGIRSVVRAQIHGASEPRYSGYTAWRAVIPFSHREAPVGLFRLHWGRGARFVFYHVGNGLFYWLAMAKAPEGEQDPEGGSKGVVQTRYRDFIDPVGAILEASDEERIFRTDIIDRKPLSSWGEGRVTILGDAAHPMTPNQAQGACQAIEDAMVLAKALEGTDDAASALRAYEEQRMKRTASFVNMSARIGGWSLMENRAAVAMRDRALKLMFKTVAAKAHEKDIAYRA